MRVLLISSSYLPVVGGLQTVVAQLAAGLQAQGHDVRVITQRHPRSLPAREVIDGVPVARWFFILPQWSDVRRGRPDFFLAGLWFFPVSLLRLLWLTMQERPAVVHVHFVGIPALFAALLRPLLSCRLVITFHGDDVESAPVRSRFHGWLIRFVMRRADVLTAPSRYLLNLALVRAPDLATPACVVPNGLSVPLISPSPVLLRPASLFAIGRFVPKKGFDVLLQALAELPHERRPPLTLVGNGPERNALERLAHALDLDVEFPGFLSHTDALARMAQADIVVMPSRQEPFGMVALEAMALAKPVVASATGGLPEVLSGAQAMLVPPNNPSLLAQSIRQALDKLACEPGWGRGNPDYAERYSMPRMVAEYLELYHLVR